MMMAMAIASPAGAAEFLGAHVWEPPRDWLGGLSGLEMAPDGSAGTALGDRAGFVYLEFERRAGRISGVRYRGARKIDVVKADSEGLAIAPDGTAYATLEGHPRLLAWPPGQDRPATLPLPRAVAELPRNAGLEGLAIGPEGALWTLPERADWSGDYALWRGADGEWSRFCDIPGGGIVPFLGFRAVGLDFDDQDRLYLLERRLSLRIGFQSRVRRLTLAPDGIAAIETLLVTEPGERDNLEGISLWRDAAGRLRMTLVSDDNYLFFQRTEFVEYALPG